MFGLFLMLGLLFGSQCPTSASAASDTIVLEKAPLTFGTDLGTALWARKSTRDFAEREIPLQLLSQILWAGDGVNRENGKRTAPAARAFQFVHIYVLSRSGNYLFVPSLQQLKKVNDAELVSKAGIQPYVASASHVLAFVANLPEFTSEAPREQKLTLANLQAGCMAQNVYLALASSGLGGCLVFSTNEQAVEEGLALTADQALLFIMPVGYPK